VKIEVKEMSPIEKIEQAIQDDMFDRILNICKGNTLKRTITVLIDITACVCMVAGLSLDEVQDMIKITYEYSILGAEKKGN
jgi:hypothetical protein